jgi:hypothetical protein
MSEINENKTIEMNETKILSLDKNRRIDPEDATGYTEGKIERRENS